MVSNHGPHVSILAGEKRPALRLGDKGFQIESLTIWIPSRPNWNIDFVPIQNLMTKSYYIESYRSHLD